MNEYYVYAFLREDRTPYYIGKGKGARCYCYHNRVGCPRPDDKNRIIKLKTNLTEEDAYRLEEYYISILGRKDIGTGILRNLSAGGKGGTGQKRTNVNYSDEYRQQKREIMLKVNREKTPEERKALGRKRLPGQNRGGREKGCVASNKGKPHSEETKRKMRLAWEKRKRGSFSTGCG